MTKENRGGKREGAGRKKISGLKMRSYRLTELEDKIIKRWIKKRRKVLNKSLTKV